MNDGFLNKIYIQKEVNGSGSGTKYELTGKMAFSVSPILDGVLTHVDYWRMLKKETFSTIHWQGEILAEYSQNELTKLLVGSMFIEALVQADAPLAGLTSTVYRPPRGNSVPLLRISLDYNPSGPFYLFTGVAINSFQLTVTRHQTIKVRIGWKALKRVEVEAAQGSGAVTSDTVPMVHSNSVIKLNGATLSQLSELSFSVATPVAPTRFGEDKIPTRMVRAGRFDISGSVVEYFDADTIANLASALGEAAICFTLIPSGTSQMFRIYWPRHTFQAGAPDGLARSEISYRADFRGSHDSEVNNEEEGFFKVVL